MKRRDNFAIQCSCALSASSMFPSWYLRNGGREPGFIAVIAY